MSQFHERKKRAFTTMIVATLTLAVAPVAFAAQPAATDEPSYPAAHPKGKYATLEKLPDWGGVWVLAGRGPNTPAREQPALKGEYLAHFEEWRKQVRENNGLAPNKGVWDIELNSPNNLKRQGWKPDSVKAGDKVTLLANPLRDMTEHRGGLFIAVTLPDGKVLGDATRADRSRPINVPTL